MLKLNKTIRFPSFRFGAKALCLSAVVSDDDELTREIDAQSVVHDDNWTLDSTPDVVELDREWTEIVEDISHDPDWIHFDDE